MYYSTSRSESGISTFEKPEELKTVLERHRVRNVGAGSCFYITTTLREEDHILMQLLYYSTSAVKTTDALADTQRCIYVICVVEQSPSSQKSRLAQHGGACNRAM